MTSRLSHIDQQGAAHMVDVSAKAVTARSAIASVKVRCNAAIVAALGEQSVAKGDVFATARIAGIQAAKKCSDLIPLCHPLPIKKVSIDIELHTWGVQIQAHCKTEGQTGVEMEAMTAASVAALTIYDMCKAIDKGMVIDQLTLLHKSGGKSGDYHGPSETSAKPEAP